jgi:four helix bundle protein
MQDFRKIHAWQRAHELTKRVYLVTKSFPREELFGLTSQMRRAAVSVPANIAEGAGRGGSREFARYLDVAFGSASELEYYALLAYDLKLLPKTEYDPVLAELTEIKRMLTGFVRSVRKAGTRPEN